MGCSWSSEDSDSVRNGQFPANYPQNHGYYKDGHRITTRQTVQAKFGEYKCICGRYWNSRLCWPDKYQNCKRCRRPVFAHSYRDLKPSDVGNSVTLPEHDQNLCQMCQDLGYSCIILKRNENKNLSNEI